MLSALPPFFRCLPVKWTCPDSRDAESVRVLLISSSSNATARGMVFPKVGYLPPLPLSWGCLLACAVRQWMLVCSASGAAPAGEQGGWETDESVEVAASRETVEEAGVTGWLEVALPTPPSPCTLPGWLLVLMGMLAAEPAEGWGGGSPSFSLALDGASSWARPRPPPDGMGGCSPVGVGAVLQEPMLGVYPFVSKKQERLAGRDKGRCLAHIFVMNVEEELAEWPESKERTRFWV